MLFKLLWKMNSLSKLVWEILRLFMVSSMTSNIRAGAWIQYTLEHEANPHLLKGVNTGFGGNADTRTNAIEELQRELMRGLHYGVMAEPAGFSTGRRNDETQDIVALLARKAIAIDDPSSATCMPESWVRGSMLIRLNSSASGASGVKLSTP
jgi:histidine ammonia-lyase